MHSLCPASHKLASVRYAPGRVSDQPKMPKMCPVMGLQQYSIESQCACYDLIDDYIVDTVDVSL